MSVMGFEDPMNPGGEIGRRGGNAPVPMVSASVSASPPPLDTQAGTPRQLPPEIGGHLAELEVCRRGVRIVSDAFVGIPRKVSEDVKSTSPGDLDEIANKRIAEALASAMKTLPQSFTKSLPPYGSVKWHVYDWAEIRASAANSDKASRDATITADLVRFSSMLLIGPKFSGTDENRQLSNQYAWTQTRYGQLMGGTYSYKVPTIVHAAFEMPFLGRTIFGDLWSAKCDQGAIAHEAVEAGWIFNSNGKNRNRLLISAAKDPKARKEMLRRLAVQYGEEGFSIYLQASGLTENDYSKQSDAVNKFRQFCEKTRHNCPGLKTVNSDFFEAVVFQSEIRATTRGLKEGKILAELTSILSGASVPFTDLNCAPEVLLETARSFPLIMIVDRICEADGMVRFLDPDYRRRFFGPPEFEMQNLRTRVLLQSARLLLTIDTIQELTCYASAQGFSDNVSKSTLYTIEELDTINRGCEVGRQAVFKRINETFNPLFEELGIDQITPEECDLIATNFVAPLREKIKELFGDAVGQSAKEDMEPITSERAYQLLLKKSA